MTGDLNKKNTNLTAIYYKISASCAIRGSNPGHPD